MGKLLKVIGVIVLIVGIILGIFIGASLNNFYYYGDGMFLIVSLPIIIAAVIFFLVLYALGNVYDVTKDTNELLRSSIDSKKNNQN